jgi:hypothetical protein
VNEHKELVARLVAEYSWGEDGLARGLRADFRCEYCGRDLLASVEDYFANWHEDHIVPRSAGGSDDSENRAVACGPCNRMKGAWNPTLVAPAGAGREELLAVTRVHLEEVRIRKQLELATMRRLVRELKTLHAAEPLEQ